MKLSLLGMMLLGVLHGAQGLLSLSPPRLRALASNGVPSQKEAGDPGNIYVAPVGKPSSSRAKQVLKQSLLVLSSAFVALSKTVAVDGDGTNAVSDIGYIPLNVTDPVITDVAFMDIQIGEAAPKRIEISLYGTIVPETVENFKQLCVGTSDGVGYKGSEIFRVISSFSIQGGNIGCPPDAPKSRIGRYGRAASAPFAPENFRILHDSQAGGVISMMKDLTNKGKQDSRFFITLSPSASWADEKYSAFGRVTNGLDTIKLIEGLSTVPPANYPETRIKIVDSGLIK